MLLVTIFKKSIILMLLAGSTLAVSADDLWDDFIAEDPDTQRDVYIQSIEYVLSEGLEKQAFDGSLFFAVGDTLPPDEWEHLAARQQDFLRLVVPLYSVQVYRLPTRDGTADRVIIEAVPGFPWSFDFWPWDITVGHANLLGGGERLVGTLGVDTQELAFRSRHIGGLPFGASGKIRNAVRESPFGYTLGSVSSQAGALKRWNPFLETEVVLTGQRWRFPDDDRNSISSFGVLLKAGLPAEWALLPGTTAGAAGQVGSYWFNAASPSIRAGAQLWAKITPVSWFMLTWRGSLDAWMQDVPEPAHFGSDPVRVPAVVLTSPVVGRSRVQALFTGLPGIAAGFTRIRLMPFVYTDPLYIPNTDILLPAGAGVKMHFGNPVNLWFGFAWGVDASQSPWRQGFVFEVTHDIY